MFFSKNKTILGIDIGTSDIKMVQITHGDRPVLDTYGIVNFPNNNELKFSDQSIVKTAEILTELAKRSGVSTNKAIVSLPNAQVFTSLIELPKMAESELNSAMEFEAKKHIPLPSAEISLSWSVVGESKISGNYEVLLTAVPKALQTIYVRLFSLAGFELKVVDIESLALQRSVGDKSYGNYAIIDIGAKTTVVSFFANELLQFNRNISFGGETVTSRIASSLNISFKRAEQFKYDFGVSDSTYIPDAIRPVLDSIKNQIKQLVILFRSSGYELDTIIVVGGGSKIPGLMDYFKDIAPKIMHGDPLKKIQYRQDLAPVLQNYKSNLALAIGLALNSDFK